MLVQGGCGKVAPQRLQPIHNMVRIILDNQLLIQTKVSSTISFQHTCTLHFPLFPVPNPKILFCLMQLIVVPLCIASMLLPMANHEEN